MHVWSDCVVRIENGLCVIRFHYVACLRPRNVVEYLTTDALVHGQATRAWPAVAVGGLFIDPVHVRS